MPALEFAAAVSGPALVMVPAGTLDSQQAPLSFDAPQAQRDAAWARLLPDLRRRLRPECARVHLLPQGGAIVGTSPLAGVVLPGDSRAAARHAEVAVRRDLWRVIDLESSGSWVEGKRVPTGIPLPITYGQRLRFGAAELLFLSPEQLHSLVAESPPPPPLDGATFVLPAVGCDLLALKARFAPFTREVFLHLCPAPFLLQIPHEVCAELEKSGELTRTIDPALILGLGRDRRPARVLVHALVPRSGDTAVTIGRRVELCAVVLPEVSVSKRHALINRREQRLTVVDLDSANGTWLDRVRLPAGVATPVRPGETLSFGTYRAVIVEPAALYDLLARLN
jgi:pSer/pThr/pTyr-binding forkhead associated (FHA) protein